MKTLATLCIIVLLPFRGHCQSDSRNKWYIPDHAKLQFAGNIGFLSAGAGYLHGHDKLETDLLLGFVPKPVGGDHIVSLTAKTTYFPWKVNLNNDLKLYPFSVGPYLSYSFGSQFDTILPNEYPPGYYWWATSLRVGAFIGGKLEKHTDGSKRFKSVAVYYELGTYDLEFISYVQNRHFLDLSDVFSMALGVKFRLK